MFSSQIPTGDLIEYAKHNWVAASKDEIFNTESFIRICYFEHNVQELPYFSFTNGVIGFSVSEKSCKILFNQIKEVFNSILDIYELEKIGGKNDGK